MEWTDEEQRKEEDKISSIHPSLPPHPSPLSQLTPSMAMASMAIMCNCCIPTSKQDPAIAARWSTRGDGSSRAVAVAIVRASLSPSSSGRGGGAGRIIGKIPAPVAAPRELYQPFRPPPDVSQATENVSMEEQLQILRERRGLWYQYAVHVPTLLRAGFTPQMIDEATGVTGVEQNKIVVASQVRSTLESSGLDAALLSEYDAAGGASQLYELRILSAKQRRSASEFAISRGMSSSKEYRELARAMKDYERRKREEGWFSFSFTPGDCLAYACYRLSKELKSDAEQREAVLKKGLEVAETEKAREKLMAALKRGGEAIEEEGGGKSEEEKAGVEVVRLSADAIASSTHQSLLLVPVAEPTVEELEAAPSMAASKDQKKNDSGFPIHRAQSAWKSWITLPSWSPLASSSSPVALSFPDSSALPWKPSSRSKSEPLLLVVDKQASGGNAQGLYVVEAGDGKKVRLQIGVPGEPGHRVLGKAVLLLRPPREDELESGIDDIEWD